MAKEKAYKILALQLGISNKKAKELIDRGIVYVGDRKVKIARAEVSQSTTFRVEYPRDAEILYEDNNLIAINKPPHVESDEIEAMLQGAQLLHRLDRETSGVLLLGKSDMFVARALEAFKRRRVHKEYVAWVEGVVAEAITIDEPIWTIKRGKAISVIDPIRGKKAVTHLYPEEVQGKKSKIRAVIETGRTHQIRVHLAHIGHPIVGDEQYGSVTQAKRILLHAKAIELLGQRFEAPEPSDIERYK